MNRKNLLFFLLAVVCFAGCGPSVQYIGKTYTVTTNVDIFFDTHDIKKDYEVMGKIDGLSGVFGSSFQEIQDKIVLEGQKRGADAVIIYNMEQRILGTTTNSTASWNTATSNHRQWLDKTIFSSSTTSSNISQNVLHADFVKYINQ